jgi:hypothetical protein
VNNEELTSPLKYSQTATIAKPVSTLHCTSIDYPGFSPSIIRGQDTNLKFSTTWWLDEWHPIPSNSSAL